ncbi:hypothetical protein MHYP_G00200890 [Metynnis hypsauchen]
MSFSPRFAGHEEEDVVKGRKSFRSQAVVSQNSEAELMLEGEDDAVSLLQDKDLDNLAGPVVLSTPAQLVAPVLAARGTLSITTTEIYFEVDEEDPAFKRLDPRVGCTPLSSSSLIPSLSLQLRRSVPCSRRSGSLPYRRS